MDGLFAIGEMAQTEGAVIKVCGILAIVGFVGCFVNRLNGPLLAFVSILALKLFSEIGGEVVSWGAVLLSILLVVASTFVNRWLFDFSRKRIREFSNGAKWGANIGSMIGASLFCYMTFFSLDMDSPLLYLIFCFVICPFGGACIGECSVLKDSKTALAPAGVAYLSYFLTSIVKVIAVVIMFFLLKQNVQSASPF